LKTTTEAKELKYLIGCLKWQFKADEHEYLVKSKIMDLLKEGNGETTKEKNPIKFIWGHKFEYD